MARRTRRSHSRSRRHHRRHKTHRKYHGGMAAYQGAADPSTYGSASSYMMATNGTEAQQYGRVFDQSSSYPPNGNAIIGMQGQRAGSKRMRHMKHSRKHKRGGFGSEAVVPLGLLALQQYYRKKHS